MSMQRTLVVGIGSPHGDDQAGWLVAEGLAARCQHARLDVRKACSPVDLLGWLQGVERLVICDACHGLGRVGEVCRFQWPAPQVQRVAWSGTHDLSLPAALALAQQLGRLPNEVVVWTVEGTAGDMETPLSVELREAVPELVDHILRDLNGEASPPDRTPDRTCTSNH